MTFDEFMQAYAQRPFEIVDGKVVEMSPPDLRHVRIARGLFRSLDALVRERDLGEVWPDNTPFLLDASKRRDWVKGSRVPDVSFVSRERMAAFLAEFDENNPLRLAPDLAIEIISPHDRYTDVHKKVLDYLRYGVRLLILIDPDLRTVRVITPDDPDGRTLHDGDTLSGDPVLPGWSMPVTRVLDGEG